jgi:hypothetical protein
MHYTESQSYEGIDSSIGEASENKL